MPKYRSEEIRNQATAAIEQAKRVIASPPGPPREILALAKQLAGFDQIGYARKVLLRADLKKLPADDLLRLMVQKHLGLYTYKDQELPIASRLKEAEDILQELLPRIDAAAVVLRPDSLRQVLELKQDTLGILGAVHKVRFTAFASRESLQRSLEYYLTGYKLGVNPDGGAYTGLNAAFILDALVSHLPPDDPAAITRRAQAQEIRSEIIKVLTDAASKEGFKPDQWYYAKLAEAYLGSGDYERARANAAQIAHADLKNWELETMARQFAHIARLQAMKEGRAADDIETSAAWSVLKILLGGNATAALSFLRGKVGLALSGGGFRASLYHIGVLASLAERDMLRHVEVISCVSGGSILGMYYYLKLRKLLQEKSDSEIMREHYIKLVREMEEEFLDGVQKNLRMRALFSPASNLSVLISRDSSTTNRLGRLYESELYAKVLGKGPHYMDEITVHPAGQPDFYPRYDNWRREAKVPIIVLNSTTLNTCHNWQFTASYMGEPPEALADAQIDANHRLRRIYYIDAPGPYRHVRLGDAVAASACVPGLFDPLVFDQLYQEDYVVRLVDGGVFDNQGVATLHEQECVIMLVSDASGQTGVDKDPSGERLGVSTRSNNVLMARIRQCEHQLLCSLQESKLLRGFMYVHLKKGLKAAPVDWLGCKDPSVDPRPDALTGYGIRHDVQRALASVRTDLDSFSNCEADALMLSGYLATAEELPQAATGFPLANPPADPGWRFLTISGIASELRDDNADLKKLGRMLDVAHSLAFKGFQLLPGIKAVKVIGATLALAASVGLLIAYWNKSEPMVKIVGILFVLFVLSIGAEVLLVRTLRYRNSVLQWIASLVLSVLGGPFLWMHLNIIDRYYINWGPKYRGLGATPPKKAAIAEAP